MALGSFGKQVSGFMSSARGAAAKGAAKAQADDDAQLAKIESMRSISMENKPEAVDNTAMNRRYDTLRARAKSDVSQATGEQQDALKRRFAQLGNLSSGAAMKQEQISQQKGAELQQRATEGIDMAQEQEAAQVAEQAKQREFAKGERIASQAFAGAESELGRRQQDRQFKASQNLAVSQFGQNMAMASKQFDLETKIQEFNMKLAKDAANEKPWYDSWSLSNIMKNTFSSQQNSSDPANKRDRNAPRSGQSNQY